MDIQTLLKQATEKLASDLFIVSGKCIAIKQNGKLVQLTSEPATPTQAESLVKELYVLTNGRDISNLKTGDDDFAICIENVGRYRVNAFRQNGTLAAVIRIVPINIPDPVKLNIPDVILNLANYQRGIVLFTGPAGSGKSTSLACLLDKINKERESHIVTIEDPMEFRHSHKKSIISQRELVLDTASYGTALRSAVRQAPCVIFLGEMRDLETTATALTAAETGHLIFSTLHTIGAAATVDRIIDVFPGDKQNQVSLQLANTLQAVVSQQLVPTVDGKIVAAYEIMVVNAAIRNLIREGKTFQIENVIQTSMASGMKTMDMSLFELFRLGVISRENALTYSVNQQLMEQRTSGQAR